MWGHSCSAIAFSLAHPDHWRVATGGMHKVRELINYKTSMITNKVCLSLVALTNSVSRVLVSPGSFFSPELTHLRKRWRV